MLIYDRKIFFANIERRIAEFSYQMSPCRREPLRNISEESVSREIFVHMAMAIIRKLRQKRMFITYTRLNNHLESFSR